jgi:hypothetical protein
VGDTSRGVLFPVLWNLCHSLGGTLIDLGYLVAMFSVGRLIAAIPLGYYCDRVRHKLPLILAQGTLISGAVLWANAYQTGSLGTLYAAQFILGCGSGSLAVTRAFVVEQCEPKQRTSVLAFLTAVQYAGFTVSPALGSGMVAIATSATGDPSSAWTYALPAYLIALLSLGILIALVTVFTNIPDVTVVVPLPAPLTALTAPLGLPSTAPSSVPFSSAPFSSAPPLPLSVQASDIGVSGADTHTTVSAAEGALSLSHSAAKASTLASTEESKDGRVEGDEVGTLGAVGAVDALDAAGVVVVVEADLESRLQSIEKKQADANQSSPQDKTSTPTPVWTTAAVNPTPTPNSISPSTTTLPTTPTTPTVPFIFVPVVLILLNITTKGSIAVYETLGAEMAQTDYGLTSTQVGVMITTCGVFGFVMLLLFKSFWTRFFTDVELVKGGMGVMVVANLVGLSYDRDTTPSFGCYIVSVVLMYALGYPVGHTAVLGAFSKVQKSGRQGALMGWFASAGSLARVVMPVVSGEWCVYDCLFVCVYDLMMCVWCG